MSETRPSILIATRNAGKLAEFERMLKNELRVEGLSGMAIELPVEGTNSYRENAETKAIFVAASTGRLTLGDDSGIEASALGGVPGIISARYAGEPVSDARNIDKLLSALAEHPTRDRAARFVCWLALADSDGLIASVEGICEGVIGYQSSGANGFGYDPVFIFPNGATMAELTDAEKDRVSHRGNALRSMLPLLMEKSAGATGNA